MAVSIHSGSQLLRLPRQSLNITGDAFRLGGGQVAFDHLALAVNQELGSSCLRPMRPRFWDLSQVKRLDLFAGASVFAEAWKKWSGSWATEVLIS